MDLLNNTLHYHFFIRYILGKLGRVVWLLVEISSISLNLNLLIAIRGLILIFLDQLREALPVLQLLETTNLLLQMLVIHDV